MPDSPVAGNNPNQPGGLSQMDQEWINDLTNQLTIGISLTAAQAATLARVHRQAEIDGVRATAAARRHAAAEAVRDRDWINDLTNQMTVGKADIPIPDFTGPQRKPAPWALSPRTP